MKLLLLSNSTNPGEDYLGWPRVILADFIRENNLKSCLFVPYAGVTVSWDDYTSRVSDVFSLWECNVQSVHKVADPVIAIQQAECIVVGGGNTFRLVQMMHDLSLIHI